MLIGNMTADPEFTRGQDTDGDRVNFGIAINKPKRPDGPEPEPTFLDCVSWGQRASRIADFGGKGRLVYVEGEVQVRRWEKDGEKRRAYGIRAWTVTFLDRRQDEEGRPETANRSSDFDDLPF